ncbi:uncharacterized protein LOC108743382 isoform X1 [Agrilus planipennis]|uniref:Uncharacterized protein LOC108743382 isoform X1 n=1 Tax=Agrilus planipennis TaxID=224129 RepID=A0A1W4XE79_AGRPL|nr:uncharacterized protein LOC108743382 isoform X1 [Agrilus planipennis]
MMNYLLKLQHNFMNTIMESAIVDKNSLSVIPTILFIFNSFFLFHHLIHRRTFRHTKWKTWFYRELTFQWAYFYMIRMWFLLIRAVRWSIIFLEYNISRNNLKKTSLFWSDGKFFNFITIFALTLLSLLPMGVFISSAFFQNNVPNFLMWIGEDPWIRSEIGMSGHYLERPPFFILPSKKQRPFRSKRSASFSNLEEISESRESSETHVINKSRSLHGNPTINRKLTF